MHSYVGLQKAECESLQLLPLHNEKIHHAVRLQINWFLRNKVRLRLRKKSFHFNNWRKQKLTLMTGPVVFAVNKMGFNTQSGRKL